MRRHSFIPLIVLCLCSALFAQAPSDQTVIQGRNNGTPVYTNSGFVPFNFIGGCTPSNVAGALTLNCGPQGAVVNTSTSGLMAMYQFTEGSGTTVNDISGNGNNITFGGTGCTINPTWTNGGLTFSGTAGTCVLLPAALSTAKTIQIFMSVGPFNIGPAPGSGFFPYLGTTGDPSSGVTHGFVLGNNPNQAVAGSSCGMCGGVTMIGNGVFQTESTTTIIGNHLYSTVLDATTDHIYFDGAETAGYGAQHGSAGIQLANQQYTFGGYTTAGEGWSAHTYYYALFYSTELTAAQVAQNYYAVLALMQQRTVQTVPAPTTQSLTPALVVDGDSVIRGTGGTDPRTLMVTADTYTGTSVGLSGGFPIDIFNNTVWRSQSLLSSWAAQNVYIVMVGENSVCGAGGPSNSWGVVRQQSAVLHAQGWKVLILTLPSRTGAGCDGLLDRWQAPLFLSTFKNLFGEEETTSRD